MKININQNLNSNLNKNIKSRNQGIDLLRVVSMYMVIVLHILMHGGVLNHTEAFTWNYNVSWLLEVAFYCAVNCYALITGYIYYEINFRYDRIISLWFQAAFYSVSIMLISLILAPGVMSWKSIIGSFLPLCTNQYWYFTAYFGLFFFIPFLNHLMRALDKACTLKLIITMVILLTILPTFTLHDLFQVDGGYSMLWMMVVYIIGAAIKKYDLFQQINKTKLLCLYAICIIIPWLSKILIEVVALQLLGVVIDGSFFIRYNSPFILFSGIFLFVLFLKIRLNSIRLQRSVQVLSATSFGVYLIHSSYFPWEFLLKDRFCLFAQFNVFVMLLCILATALAIYLICSIIDYLRGLLFRYLRINQLSQRIEKILSIFFDNLYIFIKYL